MAAGLLIPDVGRCRAPSCEPAPLHSRVRRPVSLCMYGFVRCMLLAAENSAALVPLIVGEFMSLKVSERVSCGTSI